MRNINPDNNILTAVHTYVGLSQDAEVVIHIYDASGRIVRTLDVGFQSFGYYASRDKAAYWDGRNQSGELVGGVDECAHPAVELDGESVGDGNAFEVDTLVLAGCIDGITANATRFGWFARHCSEWRVTRRNR